MSSRGDNSANERRNEDTWTGQHGVDIADVLQDSEMTQPTDGSVSEDEAGGWLGSISTDFRHMANCFKDSTLPVIGGVASLVHKTAMAVAAEIAQLERDGELEANVWRADQGCEVESLSLPWEIRREVEDDDIPIYITDGELMDAIMALSLQEDTFSTPYTSGDKQEINEGKSCILDEPRIALICRLLDIDKNLAAVHAQLSGRSSIQEQVFWRNYFHHCEQTRKEYMKSRLSGEGVRKQVSRTPSGISSAAGSVTRGSGGNSSDDSSLVPASVADDSSYVVALAPSSADTLTTTRSFGDMVFVGREAECEYVEE